MFATLTLSLLAVLPQGPADRPGLVPVPAGKTVIGAELEATIERIREMPAAANFLAGEGPRRSQEVPAFFISPTLVTNEMYLEFVKATGAMPPSSWAIISREEKMELIQAGQKSDPAFRFDHEQQRRWWQDHWQEEGREWRMDPSTALEPVVTVSYYEVQAYCAWAGLRLPTELEWTRAARGDTHHDYPYGPEFDRNRISHNASKPSNLANKILPVCSMDNASPFGVFDMVGLVYEFTDTRATKLEGWKSFKVEMKNEKGKVTETLHPAPNWDSSRILIKGGAYNLPALNCRIDTRIGYDREAAAPLVGFRVAASAIPVRDSAYLRCQSLRSSVIGGTPANELDFNRALGVEKHSLRDLSVIAGARQPHKKVEEVELSPAYAVFGPHTSFSITPLKEGFRLDENAKLNVIEKRTKKDLQLRPLAALYTDVALRDMPAVTPGAYTLMYLPALNKRAIEDWGGMVKGIGKKKPKAEKKEAEKEKEAPAEADDAKKDEEKDGDAKKKDEKKKDEQEGPSVDLSQVELLPNKKYIVIVNNDMVACGAMPLIGRPAYAKESKVDHGFVFDTEEDGMIFDLRLSGANGFAYGFKFRLAPVDAEGNSLSKAEAWN